MESKIENIVIPNSMDMYNGFKYICANINENNINYFKQNIHILGIIETVSKTFGYAYLSNIIKYEEFKCIDWKKIKILNDIGSPKQEIFNINNQEILLSPTTLRYIQFSFDMLSYAKNILKLNSLNVVEIGGGYGFQSVLFYHFCDLFNIKIDKYTIIDLPETNNLQKHFVKEACKYSENKNDIIITDYKNINLDNTNFLISNYALGEFYKSWQDYYIENVVKHIPHGYICWNFMNNTQIHEYFFKIKNIIIEEENPQTNYSQFKNHIIKY
jgi:hypothetical protein